MPNALTFDGTQGINVKNVTFRGFAGYGAHFLNGAAGNFLNNVRFENCGKSGVFLDGDVRNNSTEGLFVSGAGKHGIHLSGTNVRYNALELTPVSVTNRLGLVEHCAEYGVLIENGATFNVVHPGTVTSNAMTGILVRGSNTTHNVIGRNSNVVPRLSDITSNGGHGVHLMDGVQHTVLRYLAPAGNQGDGILLEGPDCAFNQLDGIFTGIDYYAGNSQPRLPNTGNGIHLRSGAHHNLLGSRTPGGFGERGAIVGNLGAGILLEGT
ncbi:MAG: right-handed parallel beta-helix repeat-containing protein, partial [Limisphaerales bacterium]